MIDIKYLPVSGALTAGSTMTTENRGENNLK